MSQILSNEYLKELDLIRRVSGSQRETIVREAFKDLLKNWGKENKLIFIAELLIDELGQLSAMCRCAN